MKITLMLYAAFGVFISCTAMQDGVDNILKNAQVATVNSENIHDFDANIKEIIWEKIDPLYLADNPKDAEHAKTNMLQEFDAKQREIILMVDEQNHYLAHIFFVRQTNGHIRISAPGYSDKSLAIPFLQQALDTLEIILKQSHRHDDVERKIVCTYPQNHSVEVDQLLNLFHFSLDNNVEEPGYKELCINVYKYPAHLVENVQFYSRQLPI